MSDILNLPDKPAQVEATIGGKTYLVKEASVAAATKYRNKTFSAARMNDGKMVGIEGLADAEPMLISHCLFETYQNNGELKDRPVLLSTILAWPNQTQEALFDKIKELSPRLVGGKDADPKLIGACRRDLSEQHHPDRGGNEDVMCGINLACDWLKKHVSDSKDEAKNSPSAMTESSA